MKKSLKAALFLGIAPMVGGIAIFLTWAMFRWLWLMLAGTIMIYVGCGAVAIGIVCLAVYVWRSWHCSLIPRRRLVWRAMMVLMLFAVNFIVAGGVSIGAMIIESRYTVWIMNRSSAPLESALVEGGGVRISFGDVNPGESVKRSFHIEHDGELMLKGNHATKDIEETIEGYVTNGYGGDLLIILGENGTVRVYDKRRMESPDTAAESEEQ